MTLLRDRSVFRRVAIGAAILAPALIVIAVAQLFLPRGLLDGVAKAGDMSAQTPEVLVALISDMIGIAIGCMVAAWFFYRQPVIEPAKRNHLLFALIVTASSIASTFAGLRGQYALAFIISTQQFELGQLAGFIQAQAISLIIEVMMLSGLAVHFLIFRDESIRIDAG